MGLIFSVLVVCVGVYQFIQLYSDGDKKVDHKTREINNEPTVNSSTPKIQLCRDFLSHEDVEIECTPQILRQSSKSPSPRRFLVTEKHENRSRSSSPRKFVISAESEDNSNLREFFITKGIPKDNPATKRYVLIDTKEDFREVSPLPLPKQFLVTQNKINFSHEKLEKIKQGIGVNFNSFSFKDKEIGSDNEFLSLKETLSESVSNINSTDLQNYRDTKLNEAIPGKCINYNPESEISTSLHELYTQEPVEFHRDPSPYPGLDVFVRRASITSELYENRKVPIAEIDEESPSSTLTKVDVILKSRDFHTTEYCSNKILVEPSDRWKSGSHEFMSQSDSKDDSMNSVDQKHSKIDNEKLRSRSVTRTENSCPESHMRKVSSSSRMFDEDFQTSSGLFKDVLERGGDEGFRNSLDGVKKGSEARRSFKKKKNRSQNSLGNSNA